jgi:hypothetical protein
MTTKRKIPTVEKSYVDASGIPTRVIVPEGATDLSAGIPVSLDISTVYEHMPPQFVVDLTVALHAQGLVKPVDYFTPGASDRYRAALLMVIRHDFLNLQALAKQELDKRRT